MVQFSVLYDLTGAWKMAPPKGSLVKLWKIYNDSTMFNKSYRANRTDTIPQETVELKIRNGVISYNSAVSNQNNYREIHINYLREQ